MAAAKQTQKLQADLIHQVEQESRLNHSYVALLVFSTVIATLGLLINSIAVVIGAMLISPLSWPILGMATSVFRSQRHLFSTATWSLFVSIVATLVISALIVFIIPISDISPAIIALTQPTLLDLFIALASSVIGVLAIYYPRISSTAAGVAIAISLLPPLSTAGIGIALASWSIFSRSFLLFVTNMAAMLFGAVVTMYFLHFRPRRKADEARLRIGFLGSLLLLVLLSVPLSLYFKDTLQRSSVEQTINDILQTKAAIISDQARVDSIDVQYFPSLDNIVYVEATLYVPEGTYITEKQQNSLIENLTTATNRTVDLQLNVVNTVSLRRAEDEQLRQQRTAITEFVQQQLAQRNSDATIEDIQVDITDSVYVRLSLRQINGAALSFEDKENLEQAISDFVDMDTVLEVELIPVTVLQQPDDVAKQVTAVESVLQQDLAAISNDIVLQPVTIQNHSVIASVEVPTNITITQDQQEVMQQHVREELQITMNLELHIFRFEQPAEVISDQPQQPQ